MERLKCFLVKNRDLHTRMQSRSGGVFSALSDAVLRESGVVYGCRMDEQFQAVHSRATTAEERDQFRGSKYVQSNMGETYCSVKNDLINGYKVLYSGTPCQVGGLRSYCADSSSDNLFCIDIVCHGVPSPGLWMEYTEYLSRMYQHKVDAFDFRNKKDFGWREHIETATLGKKTVDKRIFTSLFYGHNILRQSCFHCPYKGLVRPGDITIADAWGIEHGNPEFDDNKGVSIVIINNSHGETLLNTMQEKCFLHECEIKDYMQTPLKEPFDQPKTHEEFWKDYKQYGFEYIIKKYSNDSLFSCVKLKLKKYLHNYFPH